MNFQEYEVISIIGFVGVTTLGRFAAWKRYLVTGNNCFHDKKPTNTPWLTQDSFITFESICDTFIPSVNPDDLTIDNVNKSFKYLLPNGISDIQTYDINEIKTKKEFLKHGAVQANVHYNAIGLMNNFLYDAEKYDLNLILSLLGSSFGNFVVTGFPVPFQCLSLENRTIAMRRLRDSPIAQLRGAYQVSHLADMLSEFI
jgi:hypothetical protein